MSLIGGQSERGARAPAPEPPDLQPPVEMHGVAAGADDAADAAPPRAATGPGGIPLHLQANRLAAQRRAADSPAPRRVAAIPSHPPDLINVMANCLNLTDEVTNIFVVCVLCCILICTVAPLVTSMFVTWTTCDGPINVRYHDQLLNFRSRERTTWHAALLTSESKFYGAFATSAVESTGSAITVCKTLGAVSIATFVLIGIALIFGTVALVFAIMYSYRRFRVERARRLIATRYHRDPREQAALERKYPPVRGTMVVVARGLMMVACVLLCMAILPWLVSYVLVRCDERSLVPYDMCTVEGGLTWVLVALVAYSVTYLALWVRRGWISMRSPIDAAYSVY